MYGKQTVMTQRQETEAPRFSPNCAQFSSFLSAQSTCVMRNDAEIGHVGVCREALGEENLEPGPSPQHPRLLRAIQSMAGISTHSSSNLTGVLFKEQNNV